MWFERIELLKSDIAASIASLCYQCGCEIGTSRET